MKAWQAAAFGLAAVLIAACDETSSVPTEASTATPRITAPAEGSRAVSSGSQNPPSTVPPEYQHYTWISVSVDVGWNGNMAYGQAIVKFGANNATADIDLNVRNAEGTLIGSNHGSAQASYVFP